MNDRFARLLVFSFFIDTPRAYSRYPKCPQTGGKLNGDGYLDAEDTYPSTYNPCQGSADYDRDGVPDGVDACPGDRAIRDARGTIPDSDGDRFADACDCDPEYFAMDADGDFVPDSCDNCGGTISLPDGGVRIFPLVYNPGQTDAEGDGFGDACDICPADVEPPSEIPGGSRIQRDVDGDHVGDACDDCPETWDAAQRNCNADAEEVVGIVRPLGDACDPQPCPETTPHAPPRTDARSRTTVIATDELLTDALAVAPAGAAPLEARASSRWCTCSVATSNDLLARQRCESAIGDGSGSGNCAIAAPLAYRAIDLDIPGWRFPSIDTSSTPDTVTSPGGLPIEFVRMFDYPDLVSVDGRPEDHRAFTEDARVFWATELDSASLLGQPFRGVLWTHAAGPRDRAVFYPTDLPPTLSTPSATLSSHYWSGEIVPPVTIVRPFPCMPPSLPLLVWGPGFPLADSLGSVSWLVGQGELFGGNCRYDRVRDLLPFVGNGLFPVPFEVVPGLRPETFSFAGRWVAASEPGSWLPKTSVRYTVFDPAKQRLTRALAVDFTGALTVVAPPVNCPPNGCGEPPPFPGELPLAAALEVGAAAATDPARTNALLVLSARRSTLYYGGGVLPDGTQPGDLFAFDAVSGGERRIVLPAWFALGRVLAATYSPADDALYVLDEPAPSHRRRAFRAGHTARLVRIAPDGGAAEVLFETERLLGSMAGPRAAWALAPAIDGTLYLVAGFRETHVVVRLVVTGDHLNAIGLIAGRGALAAGQARATDRGLTVMTVDRLDRPHAIDYDASRLFTAPHRWERRCF